MKLPAPSFEHLERLSDDTGIIEHAWYELPRRGSGYNVDDNARALIAICRQPEPAPRLVELATRYLAFLYHARRPDERYHNCLSYERTWADDIGSDDCHGRALWALGTAVNTGPNQVIRRAALRLFEASVDLTTPFPRANAFAVIGAAEVLLRHPDHAPARRLLHRCGARFPLPAPGRWPWPEARLAYDNARIAQALMLRDKFSGEPPRQTLGLGLLDWLVGQESNCGRLSLTPVGGWAPGEPRPGFDQQPIEAAALADACATAFELTGDRIWAERVTTAARWFLGANDAGVSLFDPQTGGCRDGLAPDGANENQGAESTLACITTLQQSSRLEGVLLPARISYQNAG